MTLNQLNSLDEQELDMALYIVNHISPPVVPKMEFGPTNLTWFKHDMLMKKFVDAFPKIKPNGHIVFSSLLKKLGVNHEIKYEQPAPAPASLPEIVSPITSLNQISGSI